MASPSFLYFDLGNVLLKFSHQRAAEQMGSVTGIAAERAFEIVFTEGLHWEIERGEITPRQFYERYCAAAGAWPDYAELEQAGSDIFEPNAETLLVIESLHAAGHPLGVFSNTSEPHWRFVTGRYAFLHERFDKHALSFELGSMKPDPAIYRAAAKLAETAPADIFFTDDRPENVHAARAADYDAVLFTTAARLVADLNERGIAVRL
jgi:putative hydrolase of the HAD superfamily